MEYGTIYFDILWICIIKLVNQTTEAIINIYHIYYHLYTVRFYLMSIAVCTSSPESRGCIFRPV